MKFVHPEILWGLVALAIPIIVHLFNFRKFKKVMFSNVEFLKEIKQETQSKSKLKHLLILFSRLLALAAIIFAFAQPYIPSTNTTVVPGQKAISIYIDNSFSMEADAGEGRLLEIAKNKALEIVTSYQPSDKFQLLTSDFEGRHQRLVSREEMVELIQEVDVSASTRKLSEVLTRQHDVLINSDAVQRTAFVISDLQASVTDLSTIANDTLVHVSIVPTVAAEIENIYIDSVWFASPIRQLNQPEQLFVRITSTEESEKDNVPLSLTINGQQKSVASFNIASGETKDIEMTFTNTEPGLKYGEITLDDHPIVFDDHYFFTYNVAAQISILEIMGNVQSPDAVATVYKDDAAFKLTQVGEGAIDFGAFPQHNFIVVNQLKQLSSGLSAELIKFAQNGGSVLIVPNTDADFVSYNSLLSQLGIGQILSKRNAENKVNEVNYEHYIYKSAFEKQEGNTDLPIAQAWFEILANSQSNAEPMMKMQNGLPFLQSAIIGAGRVYVSSVSLETSESNFTSHAFFPASLIRMAEFSQPSTELAYTLGTEQIITMRNLVLPGEETFKLKNRSTGAELIPEHRNAGGNTEIVVHSDLNQAGDYELNWGTNTVGALAFNYNRAESPTKAVTIDELKNSIEGNGWGNWSILENGLESIGKSANELNEGQKLWYMMIVLALVFLAVEVLLIKFWR